MQISDLKSWGLGTDKPIVISGPCSAETEEQLFETASALKAQGINIIRAGVWKPRTRPNSFEGVGEPALKWIENVKKELGVKFAIEVANPQHIELALKHGVDVLWVGARTTVNPFTVQEIADSLKGVEDVPVLIKNPINPDLALWLGALERLNQAGVTKLGAIHRGFSSYQEKKYRNTPMWQIPIELMRLVPGLPMFGDPSHIAGNRELIAPLSQQSLDLDYAGLIIESHRDPDNAWSDAKQQVTPERLGEIVRGLQARTPESTDAVFINHLDEIRTQIDHADHDILDAIARRMKLVEQIAEYKKENNVTILQMNRWDEIVDTRINWGKAQNLDGNFIRHFYDILHTQSIRRQTAIMNSKLEES